MVARPTWKGHLRLSLVSCPVRLYNALTHAEQVHFHLLHKDTHRRVHMVPHEPELGPVERADLVRGYEYEKNKFVVVTDDDLAGIELESSKVIAIEKFVDADKLDPIYFSAPYYLTPDGAVAEETFRVIQHAMRLKNKAALSRIVLAHREHPIALMARDKGLLVMTLRSAAEIRDCREFFAQISDEEPEPEMLDLACQLIEQKSGEFDPHEFRDRYQEALHALIERKIAGEAPVAAPAPERGKVINLMEALRRSLEEGRKPPAASRPRRTGATGERKAKPAPGSGRKAG